MVAFTFELPTPSGRPFALIRLLKDEAEAIALAKGYAVAWPEVRRIDVKIGDELIHREVNVRP